MSELISGEEALEAVMNGYEIQYRFGNGFWMDYTNNSRLEEDDFYNDYAYFRLKKGSDNILQKEEDMNSGEYISGKEAKIVWASGSDVEYNVLGVWYEVNDENTLNIFNTDYKFRIKPKTININGIEVPAPFEPKEGDRYYFIHSCNDLGWHTGTYTTHSNVHKTFYQFGAWRTEEEVKKVVDALRNVLKGNI